MPDSDPSPSSAFIHKLKRVQERTGTDIVLRLSPRILTMPLPMKQHDDPFFPFGRAIITATRDLAVGYMFDLWDYLALGAAGAIALERTIHFAGAEVITLLNGLFSGAGYAALWDETAFNVDAVTLAAMNDLPGYRQRADRQAFLLHQDAHTTDPTGVALFRPDDGILTVPEDNNHRITLRVIGDEAVYAGHGEDFAQVARQVLEQKLHE